MGRESEVRNDDPPVGTLLAPSSFSPPQATPPLCFNPPVAAVGWGGDNARPIEKE